ncbi:hypothetical protein BD410DRAFT_782741 [Rickenella mellea]|uniref:Uncharacterized protein n=1 Tax=Rickenella mellea TaxID=50990 RepID=A0A4Y7QJ10_9AGAM|nr:hypothetical protein BD410DRAFT_782741 [Rickenella mellea]
MADKAAFPPSHSPSPRSRKRIRQKTNQQKRAIDHNAVLILHEHPTFANALRAWLAHTREFLPPLEHRSAFKFARSLRNFCSKGTAQPDYTETERLSADSLAQWVDDLAWSLNVDLTLKEDAGQLKTPTSRIGANFRSLIHFLAREGVFNHSDVNYLLDCCRGLEGDLSRTARVNRIMEQYAWHVQETYFDDGHTVDQSHSSWGEYEIDTILSLRRVILRSSDVNEDDEIDDLDSTGATFPTRLPAPLVESVKIGDILTLQICHLDDQNIWVPYMYSGFTPTRDDSGKTPVSRTPTELAAEKARRRRSGCTISALQEKLARVELSSMRQYPREGERRRGRRASSAIRVADIGNDDALGDGFDEGRFTEEYFQSWDGDIDSDEDLGELLSNSGGSLNNFYQTLKERHM